MGWREVADGVFQRRYNPLDVSVCVIRGADGLGLVDTRSSPRQADEIRAHLREISNRPVRWVINTHAHFDHSFGNQRFGPESDLNVPIFGHERVPAHLDEYERVMLAERIEREAEPVDEWREVVVTPPTELVGGRHTLDLGDRVVELMHFGRGHTDNDLLIRISDAAAWLLGDVIEESGPPMYGSGCFPLEWPVTVSRLLDECRDGEVLVPGHGQPVDAAFVRTQQRQLADVADLIRGLHAEGVPVVDALDAGGARWPFPSGGLQTAIQAGYAELDSRWA